YELRACRERGGAAGAGRCRVAERASGDPVPARRPTAPPGVLPDRGRERRLGDSGRTGRSRRRVLQPLRRGHARTGLREDRRRPRRGWSAEDQGDGLDPHRRARDRLRQAAGDREAPATGAHVPARHGQEPDGARQEPRPAVSRRGDDRAHLLAARHRPRAFERPAPPRRARRLRVYPLLAAVPTVAAKQRLLAVVVLSFEAVADRVGGEPRSEPGKPTAYRGETGRKVRACAASTTQSVCCHMFHATHIAYTTSVSASKVSD